MTVFSFKNVPATRLLSLSVGCSGRHCRQCTNWRGVAQNVVCIRVQNFVRYRTLMPVYLIVNRFVSICSSTSAEKLN